MIRLLLRCWIAMLACLSGSIAYAQPTHIRPELAAESLTPKAGSDITIALAMTPEPGWHGYWKNPGDAGVETRIAWTLPKAVAAGPLRYPVPQTLIVSGLMNYVYEGPYAHLVTLHIPSGLPVGTPLPLSAKINWLACTHEICVPETAEVHLDLKVGQGEVGADARARFDKWRAAMPKPLGSDARFEVAGDLLRIAIPFPAGATPGEPYFFPLIDGVIEYSARQTVKRAGDMLVIETKAKPSMNAQQVEGVFRLGKDDGLALTAIKGSVPAGGIPLQSSDGKDQSPKGGLTAIFLALGAAVLGGLLLNIMPCVFPILSLKALALARSGEGEAHARRDALAYAAGVIVVCMALGGTILALRAGGSAMGWAFQLQDPRTILLLLILMTAIALNLAGLFELPTPSVGSAFSGRRDWMGSFATGALAAFVATPCTGPFMGAALAATLVLPVAAAMAIFGGLGLGIALPFLILGFVPAFRKWLPRPGVWMVRFRHILSIPMFVTALGLGWILGRQAGVDAMALGLLAALIVALSLWRWGRRQQAGQGGAGPVFAALILCVGMTVILPRGQPVSATAPVALLQAEPFSEKRLADLQSKNRPVFVYFTADWCLTCKVNEKAAIERVEVANAFRAKNIAVLEGDWTRGDAAIGRFLSAQGRTGVPLYLFYKSNNARPDVLPQILTPSLLIGLGG